jgi:hypothetical protein
MSSLPAAEVVLAAGCVVVAAGSNFAEVAGAWAA